LQQRTATDFIQLPKRVPFFCLKIGVISVTANNTIISTKTKEAIQKHVQGGTKRVNVLSHPWSCIDGREDEGTH
jgi:hypothetical protein